MATASIKNLGKYYIYRHVRLDTNEVFYIGCGTKKPNRPSETEYSRAIRKFRRSRAWKEVVAKTDYEIDILVETDDLEFAKEKEREFIELYGRKCNGTGPLVNITEAGCGSKGYKFSKEQIEKGWKGRIPGMLGKKQSDATKELLRIKSTGRRHTQETKELCRAINLGENSPRARFKEADVLEMKRMYFEQGLRQAEIASAFKTDGGTISAIVNGKKWPHVKYEKPQTN